MNTLFVLVQTFLKRTTFPDIIVETICPSQEEKYSKTGILIPPHIHLYIYTFTGILKYIYTCICIGNINWQTPNIWWGNPSLSVLEKVNRALSVISAKRICYLRVTFPNLGIETNTGESRVQLDNSRCDFLKSSLQKRRPQISDARYHASLSHCGCLERKELEYYRKFAYKSNCTILTNNLIITLYFQ